MEELEYTIKQNKDAIEYQVAKLVKETAKLQELMATDNFHGYNATMWTEGHNSETVTAIATLIMRQRSLMDALFMVEKTKA